MTDPYRHNLSVSWEEFHRLSRVLSERLLAVRPPGGPPWRLLVAVTRGGLVPAAIVARELNLRVVDTLCIASYDERSRGQPQVLKAAGAGDGEGCWWSTTGRHRRHRPGDARAAAEGPLRHRLRQAGGPSLVDTFVAEIGQDTWIVFPWDQHPPIVGARG